MNLKGKRSMNIDEHPHTVANRIVWKMSKVDETQPCVLHMNADALVIEYNDRVTGQKCYDKVGRVKNNS